MQPDQRFRSANSFALVVVLALTCIIGVSMTSAGTANAAERRGQCLSTAIPLGWIQVDYYHSFDAERDCGATGQPSINNYQIIERHDNAPENTTIDMCLGQNVPYGWMVVANRWDTGRCGRPVSNIRNVYSIFQPAPQFNDGLSVCNGSPYPADWLVGEIDPGRVDPCGNGLIALPRLIRHSHRPLGTALSVCTAQPPSGWVIVRFDTIAGRCGYRGPDTPRNVMVISKVETEPWDLDYAMLGDSITSGQGSPPYDVVIAGGDGRGARQCRRSFRSWTWLVREEIARRRTVDVQVRACGGSTTADILSSQVNGLSAETDLVTITTGANDAGFDQKIKDCFYPFHDCSTMTFSPAEISALTAALVATYAEVKRRVRPQTRILVLGYPKFFRTTTVSGCLPTITQSELDAIDRVWNAVHVAIRTATAGAGVTYVDIVDGFAGHRICDPDPYATALSSSETSTASFHPNARGERRIFDLLVASGLLPLRNF
jgi:lysophospholipase L1-like esterase